MGVSEDRALSIIKEGKRETDIFAKDNTRQLDKRLSQELAGRGWFKNYFLPPESANVNLFGEIDLGPGTKRPSLKELSKQKTLFDNEGMQGQLGFEDAVDNFYQTLTPQSDAGKYNKAYYVSQAMGKSVKRLLKRQSVEP